MAVAYSLLWHSIIWSKNVIQPDSGPQGLRTALCPELHLVIRCLLIVLVSGCLESAFSVACTYLTAVVRSLS